MKDPLTQPRDNPFVARVKSTAVRGWASWAMFPVCLPQALWVRFRQTRLMPPSGPMLRKIGPQGEGSPYRVLVLGDSTVAGVGTADLDDGLAVKIGTGLSKALNRRISLHIAGSSSATAADIRDHVLRHLPRDRFDLVVLVIGVNDAKNLVNAADFSRNFGTLIYSLKARFPSALIAHCPIVPLKVIPLLPQPLKTFLSWRSDVIDAHAACLCASRGIARFTRHDTFPIEGFARDGFHVNETGCALWADEVVRELAAMPRVRSAAKAA